MFTVDALVLDAGIHFLFTFAALLRFLRLISQVGFCTLTSVVLDFLPVFVNLGTPEVVQDICKRRFDQEVRDETETKAES